MTLHTMLEFLIGRRDAIEDVAQTPRAIWLGLLFVLSAGLAREYDGEDLLHEPWHLLIPLAASLVTSTLLYGLLWLVLRGWRTFPPHAWRSFLTCYWLTAPLAWIYAVPVERLLSAADATSANLCFLAIVALWRVVLIIRVVSVLFRAPLWKVGFTVLLFADVVVMGVLQFTPIPLIAIMGGVRLSESEQVLQRTAMNVFILGFVSSPIWFFGTVAAAFTRLPDPPPDGVVVRPEAAPRVSWGPWLLAALSLLVWLPILPSTQREQRLRYDVEQAFRHDDIAMAIELMTAHEPEDFPPHWDPPPRIAFAQPRPPLRDVVEAVLDVQPKRWVRDVYLQKFADQYHAWSFRFYDEEGEDEEQWRLRRLSIIERLPADAPGVHEQFDWLKGLLYDERLKPELRQRIERLLQGHGHELPQLPKTNSDSETRMHEAGMHHGGTEDTERADD